MYLVRVILASTLIEIENSVASNLWIYDDTMNTTTIERRILNNRYVVTSAEALCSVTIQGLASSSRYSAIIIPSLGGFL